MIDYIFQRLPDRFLLKSLEKMPRSIRLQLPNGQEKHVHFKKSEHSLLQASEFIQECRSLFGSIMVYSYKGNGCFLVHVVKDDLCEVDYFGKRTIPRAPIYVKGNSSC